MVGSSCSGRSSKIVFAGSIVELYKLWAKFEMRAVIGRTSENISLAVLGRCSRWLSLASRVACDRTNFSFDRGQNIYRSSSTV